MLRLAKDTVAKVYFKLFPELLIRLVAALLRIPRESILEYEILNSDIPADNFEVKFCRMDFRLIINGIHVILEIQTDRRWYCPERPLFNWALEFSSCLDAGEQYTMAPQVVVITITDFEVFPDGAEAAPDAAKPATDADAAEAATDCPKPNPYGPAGSLHMVQNVASHLPMSDRLKII